MRLKGRLFRRGNSAMSDEVETESRDYRDGVLGAAIRDIGGVQRFLSSERVSALAVFAQKRL